MLGNIALCWAVLGAMGCGIRELEVFAPVDVDEGSDPLPPPVPRFDAGSTPAVQIIRAEQDGDILDGDIGLDQDPVIRPDARVLDPTEGDDDDAGTVRPVPEPGEPCPAGSYTGTISCTFPATGARLAGSISLSVEQVDVEHTPQEVTGTLNLLALQGDSVEINGTFTGTAECDAATLKVTTADPLGGQVPGFLSAVVPATLEATYNPDTNDFKGDVNLPGGSGCAGTWSALENLLD